MFCTERTTSKYLDTDNDGALSFKEFKRTMYLVITFQVLDNNADGCLDRMEVRESFEVLLSLTLTDDEFKDAYSEMEPMDGSISFKEYRKYFKHPNQKKNAILGKR